MTELPADPSLADLTEGQLQAAFLAARAYGVVLKDEVIRAVVGAVFTHV